MTTKLEIKLQEILSEMGVPENVTFEQVQALVNKYITEPAPSPHQIGGDRENILIIRDKDQVIKSATSNKVGNLQFRLGGLLEEVLNLAIEVPGGMAFPPKLIKAALDSYRRLRELAITEINENQAKVLLTIFRLIQDYEIPTTDLIHHQVELDKIEIIEALEVLSQLDCIQVNDNGAIELFETIIVKQDDFD